MDKTKNPSFILIICTFLSCNQLGTAKFTDSAVMTESESNNQNYVTLNFDGLASFSNKTDSTITLNWTPHRSAVAYDIYQIQDNSKIYLTTAFGQEASSVDLTNLTPEGDYTFRVNAKVSNGLNDSNLNDLSVTMNSAPDTPEINLAYPASSPSLISRPRFLISNIKTGDIIKLYSDSTCSNLISSSEAEDSTIELTSSSLSPGTYSFSTRSSNSIGNNSICSPFIGTYQKLSCPDGYIPVPANSSLGVMDEFCVMKYEAKNVGGVATSQPALTPWTGIKITEAKIACTNLGSGYDLISNPEWMAIAYSIESNASNWSNNTVGDSSLYRGHSDKNPLSTLDVSDSNDSYDGTGNNSTEAMGAGKEQRRTLELSNGEIIWDLSGNAYEWVDWTLGGSLGSGPINCPLGLTEIPLFSCSSLSSADFEPLNPSGILTSSYNSNFGLGKINGGTGGASLRGGSYNAETKSGIYHLIFSITFSQTFADYSFRCVFRP